MKKDSLLLEFSFVTYMDRKDHTTENGKYMDFSDKIEESIHKIIARKNQPIYIQILLLSWSFSCGMEFTNTVKQHIKSHSCGTIGANAPLAPQFKRYIALKKP